MTDRPLLPKRLVFDPHAIARMRKRDFSVLDVRTILYKVVSLDRPNHYYIITVEWLYG